MFGRFLAWLADEQLEREREREVSLLICLNRFNYILNLCWKKTIERKEKRKILSFSSVSPFVFYIPSLLFCVLLLCVFVSLSHFFLCKRKSRKIQDKGETINGSSSVSHCSLSVHLNYTLLLLCAWNVCTKKIVEFLIDWLVAVEYLTVCVCVCVCVLVVIFGTTSL
jgi:hypothetical protein